jgi:hypothetical protein
MVTKNTIAFLLVGAMFTVISTKIIGGHDVSIKSGDLVKLLEGEGEFIVLRRIYHFLIAI